MLNKYPGVNYILVFMYVLYYPKFHDKKGSKKIMSVSGLITQNHGDIENEKDEYAVEKQSDLNVTWKHV